MKNSKLKSMIAVAIFSISGALQAQWAGNWYPAPGWNSAQPGYSFPGIQNATPWALGGNTLISPQNSSGKNNYSCGTLDGNIPFALKSNGIECIFMDIDQRVAIGANHQPSVPNCALDIRGKINPSNFRIYGNLTGDVESTTSMRLYFGQGNSFEVNHGSVGNAVVRFKINSIGFTTISEDMNVGGQLWGTGARLGVDGRTKTGLTIVSGAGQVGFQVCNTAGAPRFFTMEDGKTRIAGNTEIGFINNVGFADPNPRLNIDAQVTPGIKISRNNGGGALKMIYVQNVDVPAGRPHFEVLGDGTTYIGQGRPLLGGVAAGAKLSVDGMVLAQDIRVSVSMSTHWADYVFEKGYKLMPLAEIEKYVQKNHHLPEVPSEAEVKTDGMDITSMNVILLKKIEELYLHTIELKKQLDEQNEVIDALRRK